MAALEDRTIAQNRSHHLFEYFQRQLLRDAHVPVQERDVVAAAIFGGDAQASELGRISRACDSLIGRRARSSIFTSSGRSSLKLTSDLARLSCSLFASSASRTFGFLISSSRATSVSMSPNCCSSSTAVLGPIPGTFGTLSIGSPISAR